MSAINLPQGITINNFIADLYMQDPKNVIFWDTCALLDVLRFPFRDKDVQFYKMLNSINGMIQAEQIYSVASFLTVREWNDNEVSVKAFTEDSLSKTDGYHSNCISIINEVFGLTLASEQIRDKGLLESLEQLADSILAKTFFIETNEIAQFALSRVAQKRPPSKKKPEFKDCAVWETALILSQEIFVQNKENIQVFYTSNTDDFVDKTREPHVFNSILVTEASSSMLKCCFQLSDVIVKL